MRAFLIALLVFCQCHLKAEIYDCFTFFNEIELLHVRLAELYDVVDHFVIVESPISFTGKSKPLYYGENAKQFAKYKDKIIHLVIDNFPGVTGDKKHDHWYREEYSRNYIMNALQNCKRDDIIFISDLDEIPRATSVIEIQHYLDDLNNQRFTWEKKKRKKRDKDLAAQNLFFNKKRDNQFVCSLDMRFFTYQLNLENMKRWVGGSKAVPFWFLKDHTPWQLKIYHHEHKNLHIVYDAGWHFNTMGGKDLSLYKWKHTGPTYECEDIMQTLEQDSELLEKTWHAHIEGNPCTPVPIDSGFPKYIIDNIEHFRAIGWLEPVPDNK